MVQEEKISNSVDSHVVDIEADDEVEREPMIQVLKLL